MRTLKDRSGLSYAELARRMFTSSSTLHRYCVGTSVPSDYTVVMRFAQECGATAGELAELLRCWMAATGSVTEQPVVAQPRWKRPVGVLAIAALLLTVSAAGGPSSRPQSLGGQWISGPSWVRPPEPVLSTLFGVTLNSATGAMPSFRVGGVRFWDGRTRWANLEPRPGEFDWTVLDRMVGGANQAGLPALFVFGGTPPWAAPRAPAMPYDDGSRAAPPDDLARWDAVVRAVAQRYSGRIEAYELWPIGNQDRYFHGSVETLVDMTRRANEIIKASDPRVTVVCPGMGELWKPESQRFLQRFAELGGYRYCDVAGVKLFQRTASDPPEDMVDLLAMIDRTFHTAGVHPTLWNTGTTYDIPLQGSLDAERAANYAVRFYLVGMYGTATNLRRMYFYNWGGTKIPIVLQAEGGAPTKAALAVEQLQRWLAHAQIRSCGHGLAVNQPDNVWQCEFVIDGRAAVIRWTRTGTATVDAGPRDAVHHLDGTVTESGDTIHLTEQPVLITER